jgi:hypothetical protein
LRIVLTPFLIEVRRGPRIGSWRLDQILIDFEHSFAGQRDVKGVASAYSITEYLSTF